MNKQTIELIIPEGYEVADGEQPRLPVAGDYLLGVSGEAIPVDADYESCRYIILRKKAPKYERIELELSADFHPDCNRGQEGSYVEIQALKDALPLIPPCGLDSEERAVYKALKALVEGE